jgi:hypothetical protein
MDMRIGKRPSLSVPRSLEVLDEDHLIIRLICAFLHEGGVIILLNNETTMIDESLGSWAVGRGGDGFYD